MSRLEILEKSLEKKKEAFSMALEAHYAEVRKANGQPLNDKRNGRATLAKWAKQDDALRVKDAGIKKTEEAIERERAAIARVERAEFPACIQALIDNGTLTVWRKFPSFLFVKGVGKARIHYKNGEIYARYVTKEHVTKEEFTVFKNVFNGLKNAMEEQHSPMPKEANE